MARIKRGIQTHKRHKKLLKLTKGYKLGRKNLFRQAKQAVLKAGTFAYRDRRNKKRDFRRLWIVQMNAAVRAHGLNYSQFINGLEKAELTFNRKVLAELSIKAPAEFAAIVEKAKKALEASK
ncbi:MAG TPA: 50S ribosomal protein L20 [Candidatus Saccharimonadales bacterium]|nr:50S ribosomal protein L20 [Candidatus Saccharimonadales bacterium]